MENTYSHAQGTTVQLPHGAYPGGEEVLDLCEQYGVPFISFFSLAHGLPKAGNKLTELARKHTATEAQLNLAWLLPIAGASSWAHLRENLKPKSSSAPKTWRIWTSRWAAAGPAGPRQPAPSQCTRCPGGWPASCNGTKHPLGALTSRWGVKGCFFHV
ncbi:aldo-keto reductase family protein [Hymenobacter rubidus]|uniref:hypothetical protein n=1 Tax=Hymenobacter rubidus TaxID=1441626 RepID=UPI00191E117D|nr:hypothetical protein [Hymenobacter rubidus]